MTPKLDIVQLAHGKGLGLPAYESEGAAGLDLAAAVTEPVVLQPGARVLIPTGLVLQLPTGHEGQVRPRSGLAVKHCITVINAPGTIDEDYRGEVHVPLINLGDEAFTVTRGMRVAQLVVAPVTRVSIRQVDDVSTTRRGTGGFGSTGTQ